MAIAVTLFNHECPHAVSLFSRVALVKNRKPKPFPELRQVAQHLLTTKHVLGEIGEGRPAVPTMRIGMIADDVASRVPGLQQSHRVSILNVPADREDGGLYVVCSQGIQHSLISRAPQERRCVEDGEIIECERDPRRVVLSSRLAGLRYGRASAHHQGPLQEAASIHASNAVCLNAFNGTCAS
jgi:hypothetical protein